MRTVYAVDMQNGAIDEKEMCMLIEQTLTPEEWELLYQYSIRSVSIEELAAARGVTPVALRVQMHRMRRKLRKVYYGL